MKASLLCTALAIASGSFATAASATVVTTAVSYNLASGPYSFDFGSSGVASVILSLVDTSRFATNPDGIATTGTAQVLSLGAPFYNPPQPTSFFSDRGGSIGPGTLGVYASYAKAAPVPYSLSDSIIGLKYTLSDGVHYGYAEVAGATLFGFRYDTAPGVGVAIAPVPEPASWALMLAGFSIVGVALRRRAAPTVLA